MKASSILLYYKKTFPILLAVPALIGLYSCSPSDAEKTPAKKVFAPGEIRADDIEYIALCEVGEREGNDLNFRSRSVIDKGDLYYVSIVARPYVPNSTRTVVVNSKGEVVEYHAKDLMPSTDPYWQPPKTSARASEAASSS